MKYIASCSFGKDSVATVILAHLHNEPIDEIVFSEVMFDKDISGENPLHVDFVYNKAIPTFESWGYKVTVLRSNKTYLDCFYHKVGERAKPDRVGKYSGFPLCSRCVINRDCKVPPIKKYIKQQGDVTQYIGIAIDEPQRLKRLENTNKVSLLAKYGYTEKMVRDLCIEYGLLSPIYEVSTRNGCWFCPNCKDSEFLFIKKNYNHLWDKLKTLAKTPNLISYKFNRKETFEELDGRLEEQLKQE